MKLLRKYFCIYKYWLIIFIFALLFLSIGACQSASVQPSPNPTPEPTLLSEREATPTSSTRLSPTPVPTDTPENGTLTLTLWTVEEISPEAEGEVGDFFDNTLREFKQENPNVKVDVILKKPSGKGGILDFLRTSQNVAPTVLPDVVIMNAPDLNQAYTDNLILPLDGRLDRSIVQDLLPAARRMGTINDELVGVPIGLEMEHTVYSTATFTTTPITWTTVLSREAQYLFPAKGTNGLVNDTTLSLYFSRGGRLLDPEGKVILDEQPLREVLEFYRDILENNVISTTILEAATTEELWPIYRETEIGMAQVSVEQYLTDRKLLHQTTYGPLPVKEIGNTPVLIMHGWVLALVTDDVGRQPMALELLEWFLSTNNNATWNSTNNSMPSRDSSFQALANGDPYWSFLAEQLNTAHPKPDFAEYDRIGRIMQQAVVQVISGEATPEEAAATAIDALAQ